MANERRENHVGAHSFRHRPQTPHIFADNQMWTQLSCICSPGTNNGQHGSFHSLSSYSNLIVLARDFAKCEYYNQSNYPCFFSMKSTRELESREQTALYAASSVLLIVRAFPNLCKSAR